MNFNICAKHIFTNIFLVFVIVSFIFSIYNDVSYKNINVTFLKSVQVHKNIASLKHNFASSLIEENNKTVFKNISSEIDFDETFVSNESLSILKNIIKCKNMTYEFEIKRRGVFRVYANYVKADHGDLECHQDVTLTTHGSFRYLDNLEELVQRWSGPISVAIYTPGSDFDTTLKSIQYLRQCSAQNALIKQWVTFHIYFLKKSTPLNIYNNTWINYTCNCSLPPPYNVEDKETFQVINNLTYPVNVGRNIAREQALTHYILSLDIELYPISKLGAMFLNMLVRNSSVIYGPRPRVFAIKPFEVLQHYGIPNNKTEVIEMLNNKMLRMFHFTLCPLCHMSPLSMKWFTQGQTKYMDITGVGKRLARFMNWEAVFISSKNDPGFEDKLSWEGKSDKMTQSYIMCLLDYDFLILSNAFVVHRVGIKTIKDDLKRARFIVKQTRIIKKQLKKKYIKLYGHRKGCKL